MFNLKTNLNRMLSIESEERPWGRFFVIHDQPTYKLKRIEVDPGGRLSYQFHHKRSEVFCSGKINGNISRDARKTAYSSK